MMQPLVSDAGMFNYVCYISAFVVVVLTNKQPLKNE